MISGGLSPEEATAMLQKWAAVIGKAASDTVAGFIEGTADRSSNMRVRAADYRAKLQQLFAVHGALESRFPKEDMTALLSSPKSFARKVADEAGELWSRQVINALDMLYFWMRQPRARVAFRKELAAATPEERQIVLHSQRLLTRQRTISEMFLDNLVGKDFSVPLAFYLDRAPQYLRDMDSLESRLAADGKP